MSATDSPAIEMRLPPTSTTLLRQLTYAIVHSVRHNLERGSILRKEGFYDQAHAAEDDILIDVYSLLTKSLELPLQCMDNSYKLLEDYIMRQPPAPLIFQTPQDCPRCKVADLMHNERTP